VFLKQELTMYQSDPLAKARILPDIREKERKVF